MDTPWHRQRIIALGLLVSLLLWNLPYGGLVLYPFKLLATWLHELSHGLVMIVTGAGFDRMDLYRDTSGLAFAHVGVGRLGRAAIATAGYMGTPLFGALMLVWGQTGRSARRALAALGVLMGLSALLYGGNRFGVIALSVGAAACLGLACCGGRRVAIWMVNFTAAQACINALLDIRVLFRAKLVVNGKVMGASDAHNMAAATTGTAEMWAALWLAWSLVLLYAALRVTYLRQTERPRPTPTPALDRPSPAPPPAV
ncbi:M50 family metallopeptidase [Haliangium sp.]|uniref:M50 family metallopeptidase n=1 Tax=Haliangium sp. TaxID=2663208 RepID=UPI003D11DD91